MKSILNVPLAYRLFVKTIGGGGGRTIFVSEYLKPKAGDRMLDIGCGEAAILDYLPQVEYIGFDISEDYISAATKRYGDRGCFFCRAVTQDTIDEIGTFDLVLASGVLHHLTDAQALDLFQLASRALKVDGRLVTFDGCYLPKQSLVVRYLLKADRGKFVRTREHYVTLAKQCFPSIKDSIREDLLVIPYTHLIMECAKG